MAAALEVVDQYRDPNQPIGVTIPLTGTPEPKKFAWLECELEVCPYLTVGIEAATEALGWEMIKINFESANPGPAMQQAIDAGADFIASSGTPRSLYEEQAMAAKEAGIKMLSCFDAEPPAATRPTSTCSAVTPRSSEDRNADGRLDRRRLGGRRQRADRQHPRLHRAQGRDRRLHRRNREELRGV